MKQVTDIKLPEILSNMNGATIVRKPKVQPDGSVILRLRQRVTDYEFYVMFLPHSKVELINSKINGMNPIGIIQNINLSMHIGEEGDPEWDV